MKHIIRKFAIWLEIKTRKWVVPSAVWRKLENGDFSVRINLSNIAAKWGTIDPELVKATISMCRMEDYAND